MTNQVARLKRAKKNNVRAVDLEQAKTLMQQTKKSINFNERVLPRTIVVDVQTGSLVIGNDTQTIGEITDRFTVVDTAEGGADFIKFLEDIDPTTIDKVIMDNKDGFKIRSFDEFVTDIKKWIANNDSE